MARNAEQEKIGDNESGEALLRELFTPETFAALLALEESGILKIETREDSTDPNLVTINIDKKSIPNK